MKKKGEYMKKGGEVRQPRESFAAEIRGSAEKGIYPFTMDKHRRWVAKLLPPNFVGRNWNRAKCRSVCRVARTATTTK